MSVPYIRKPYHNCTIVNVNDRTYYFSYETIVAYENSNLKIRIADFISNTTSKHLSKMNVTNFEKMQNDLLNTLIFKDSL